MKAINWFSVLLVLYISASACAAAPVAESPAADVDAPVKRFLSFYYHEYKRGLPEKSQLPVLASFLAPELLDLFDAALRGEDCYARKNNYDGPPLVEGDVFSSLFEGATLATYRPIVQDTDSATIEIEWTNNDEVLSSTPFVWKDRVILVKTSNGWLIADFAHLGTWEFMMKGNVSQVLREVAKECTD